MTDALAAALQRARHLRGERVLYRDNGTPIAHATVRAWLEACERRAGLEVQGCLHKLRHTFCSHLAMRGAPAKAIQELAGHENRMTTLRYMHLSPAARKGAITLLNERVRGGRFWRDVGDEPQSKPRLSVTSRSHSGSWGDPNGN
jgi:integrase